MCSALVATAPHALVTARGHRIVKVEEIPLVVDKPIQNILKFLSLGTSAQTLIETKDPQRFILGKGR